MHHWAEENSSSEITSHTKCCALIRCRARALQRNLPEIARALGLSTQRAAGCGLSQPWPWGSGHAPCWLPGAGRGTQAPLPMVRSGRPGRCPQKWAGEEPRVQASCCPNWRDVVLSCVTPSASRPRPGSSGSPGSGEDEMGP